MEVNTFIRQLIARTILFGFMMFLIWLPMQALAPVINNEIAMTQMENSNAALVLMESYEKIKPLVPIAKTLIIAWFGTFTAIDIYKFAHHMNNNEKEN